MTNVLYGELKSEKIAEENKVCRQIVKEIGNFGVNQRQLLYIIHLLSLELENVEHMKSLSKLARELGSEDVFLIGNMQEDEEVK